MHWLEVKNQYLSCIDNWHPLHADWMTFHAKYVEQGNFQSSIHTLNSTQTHRIFHLVMHRCEKLQTHPRKYNNGTHKLSGFYHILRTLLSRILFIEQLIGDMQMVIDIVCHTIDEPNLITTTMMTSTTTATSIKNRTQRLWINWILDFSVFLYFFAKKKGNFCLSGVEQFSAVYEVFVRQTINLLNYSHNKLWQTKKKKTTHAT